MSLGHAHPAFTDWSNCNRIDGNAWSAVRLYGKDRFDEDQPPFNLRAAHVAGRSQKDICRAGHTGVRLCVQTQGCLKPVHGKFWITEILRSTFKVNAVFSLGRCCNSACFSEADLSDHRTDRIRDASMFRQDHPGIKALSYGRVVG